MDVVLIIGWILILVITLYSLYWYFTSTFDYWEKRGVQFIPPQFFISYVPHLLQNDTHQEDIQRIAKYGRIFGFFEGRKPNLVLADPDLIKNVLVKDFHSFINRRDLSTNDDIIDNMVSIVLGEKWKRIRSIISPTFSTGKIKRTTSIFMDSAETLCKNFENCANNNEDINAKKLFGAFTMDVIASSAFGTKIDSHNDPDNRFVVEVRNISQNKFPIRFFLFCLFPSLVKYFQISVFPPSAKAFFKDVIVKIIDERERTGKMRNDFLQLLIEARSVDKSNKESQEGDEKKPEFKHLTQDELLAQCIIFFLAGYDTTASTLSFASYLLALNPDCQEKVIKEIDAVLEENKGEITYEGIHDMKYLDTVISETLRLYPPAYRLERSAVEDYVLGDTGITITKDMLVDVPVYAMHHDPEFYPDPEKFDPDRFTAENKASRHQYVYLPFGAGPRNCVGMRFALMEVKICLVKIFSRFRLKKSPNTKIPLKLISTGGLLQPAEPISLAVEKRTDLP